MTLCINLIMILSINPNTMLTVNFINILSINLIMYLICQSCNLITIISVNVYHKTYIYLYVSRLAPSLCISHSIKSDIHGIIMNPPEA